MTYANVHSQRIKDQGVKMDKHIKLPVSFYTRLSQDKDGKIDIIKLVRLMVAKKYIANPDAIVPAYYILDSIRRFIPDLYTKDLYQSIETYVNRAKKKLPMKRSKLDLLYFVHINNFNWMYPFIGNRQYSFSRGKGITQKIRIEELVEFCCELTKRVVKAGGSKSMSRQYMLLMKDSLSFKLSYHKLSGMLRVLDELWLVHKSQHNIDEPAVYTLGGHNPFKYLVKSKLFVVKLNKEIKIDEMKENIKVG